MNENTKPENKQEFLTLIGHSLEVLEGGLISSVNRQSIRNSVLEVISNLMDQRDSAIARSVALQAGLSKINAILAAPDQSPDREWSDAADNRGYRLDAIRDVLKGIEE